jgi:hypoxanthine phosphoribosyltransferase
MPTSAPPTITPKKGRLIDTGKGEHVRILIPRATIHRRIADIAKQIRADFPNEPLHLVGVLKGAVFFLADLARQIRGEVSFDFIAVSSYGKGTHSSGQVRLTRDLESSIDGRTVIIVEDILDTGMTLEYLLRIFQQRKPKNLKVAVLLDKPDRRITKVHADYTGFQIPNEFVVGYGLDYAERYRNLLDVGILLLPEAADDEKSGAPISAKHSVKHAAKLIVQRKARVAP